MADVTVAPQVSVATGIVPSFTSLNASDSFKITNNGSLILYVKETAASTANVTVETPATLGGLAVAEQVVALTASQEKVIGKFPRNIYGDTLTVTADGTNVDLAAIQV